MCVCLSVRMTVTFRNDLCCVYGLALFRTSTRRFFPYYTYNIIAGIDEEGKGCVYSFDPVGSYERETYRAGGSASSMLQVLLDNQVDECGPMALSYFHRIVKVFFSNARAMPDFRLASRTCKMWRRRPCLRKRPSTWSRTSSFPPPSATSTRVTTSNFTSSRKMALKRSGSP